MVLALHILFCCNTHVQWNLDTTSLYITKSPGITDDFRDPSNSTVKYMKKNLDMTKPRHSEENWSVPWPFIASRSHCNTIWNNSQVFFFFNHPLPLWGFSRIMKHNWKPTGRRQTGWLFYKRGRGSELGASKLQVQRFNRSATLLPFLELLYRVWVKLPTSLNILLEYIVFTWGNAQSLWVPFVTK